MINSTKEFKAFLQEVEAYLRRYFPEATQEWYGQSMDCLELAESLGVPVESVQEVGYKLVPSERGERILYVNTYADPYEFCLSYKPSEERLSEEIETLFASILKLLLGRSFVILKAWEQTELFKEELLIKTHTTTSQTNTGQSESQAEQPQELRGSLSTAPRHIHVQSI